MKVTIRGKESVIEIFPDGEEPVKILVHPEVNLDDGTLVISEPVYYLLSELITMPDRILAQKIELLIWQRGPTSRSVLSRFVDLLVASEDGSDFYKKANAEVATFDVKWHVSENGVVAIEDPHP